MGAVLPLLKGPGVRGLGWGSCGPGALGEGRWERLVRDVSARLSLLDAFRPSCGLLCPGSAPRPPILAGAPLTRGSVPSADLHGPFPVSLSEAETPPLSGSSSALERRAGLRSTGHRSRACSGEAAPCPPHSPDHQSPRLGAGQGGAHWVPSRQSRAGQLRAEETLEMCLHQGRRPRLAGRGSRAGLKGLGRPRPRAVMGTQRGRSAASAEALSTPLSAVVGPPGSRVGAARGERSPGLGAGSRG